ncbi:MAG TPA: DNA translocase FtsK 4TM domain-containing protein [Solirubrobacteraceae bacterium]|nr:DNA translocase FtsK 4TM domain-containing protein [Solirubrobacteraceae bacterium]
MAASARRKPRARRSAPARPTLEQRHWDLIGLGLVACAIFLAFLVYLGWEGGTVGSAVVDALKDLVGEVHVLVPVAMLAAGALIVMRPVLPAVRPFRAAAGCLLLSSCLALAAGTLGLGGVSEAREDRGGLLGEWLYQGSSSLLGDVGAHVIAVFVFLAGALLLTGASVAGVIKATGDSVTTTGRRVRERAEPVRTAVSTRMRTAREELAELETSEFTAVKRRRDRPAERAPGKEDFWSGAERFPDLYDGSTAVEPEPQPELDLEPAPEPAPELPPVETEVDAPRLAEDPETDEPGVMRAGPGREVADDELTPAGRYRGSVTDSPEFVWTVPDPRFLTRSTADASRPDTVGQEKTAAQLVEALGHFGVQAKVIGMVAGPHITRYELRLAPGIKVGKVAQLKDDLAYALAASDIRILAPIPGKQAVGVEVPNARRRIVHLGDVLQAPPEGWSPLTVWLGKDVAGRSIGADLAKMPHLLVAGTTGAGKSGCVNAMLASVLLRATPHEVRLVLVDPKQVELNHYDSIPHLLTPVITSPKQAAVALQNLVREMEQRYSYMALARTRNLIEMNKVRASRGEQALPYILCVIDELADLMMVAPADVEDSIIRLAQKARAVGIHLVLATQSPRVDVITGMIKANVPSRIAFSVSSQTDSRVILDQNGAETLLGQGDMLFAPVGSSRLQRIQGAYIDEEQIAELTEEWRRQGEPELRAELLEAPEEDESADGGADDGFDPDEDPLLSDAIRLVAEMQTASTSMLQRRLRLGYTRAGRLIDMLERRGVISGYEGSKPRQVLISEADVPRVLAALDNRGDAVAVPDDEDPPDLT